MITKTIDTVFKEMKGKGQFYGKINPNDMISYNRSGGFHSVTVHYYIGKPDRKTEGYDTRVWLQVEMFLRQRFNYNCERKERIG